MVWSAMLTRIPTAATSSSSGSKDTLTYEAVLRRGLKSPSGYSFTRVIAYCAGSPSPGNQGGIGRRECDEAK